MAERCRAHGAQTYEWITDLADPAQVDELARVALSEMIVEGIKTNIPLHQELLLDEKFLRGGTSIHYLEEKLAKRRQAA